MASTATLELPSAAELAAYEKALNGLEVSLEVEGEGPLDLAVAASYDNSIFSVPPIGVRPGQLFYIRLTIHDTTIHVWKAIAKMWLVSPSGISFFQGEQETLGSGHAGDLTPSTDFLYWSGQIAEGEPGIWQAHFEVRTRHRWFIWFDGPNDEATVSIVKVLKPGEEPPYVPPAPGEGGTPSWFWPAVGIGGVAVLGLFGVALIRK